MDKYEVIKAKTAICSYMDMEFSFLNQRKIHNIHNGIFFKENAF